MKPPPGDKRPADAVGNAIAVARIATGENKKPIGKKKAVKRKKPGGNKQQ